MNCDRCGADFDGDDDVKCPECGEEYRIDTGRTNDNATPVQTANENDCWELKDDVPRYISVCWRTRAEHRSRRLELERPDGTRYLLHFDPDDDGVSP